MCSTGVSALVPVKALIRLVTHGVRRQSFLEAFNKIIYSFMGLKELFQNLSLLIAIVGGLVAIFRALLEVTRNREQRELELRWNRAKLAKEFLDEIEIDFLIQNAKNLLDLDKRKYKISESQTEIITISEVLSAL